MECPQKALQRELPADIRKECPRRAPPSSDRPEHRARFCLSPEPFARTHGNGDSQNAVAVRPAEVRLSVDHKAIAMPESLIATGPRRRRRRR
jgi:hypothetical protein